eukprot:TRINITY_DN2124_c0_g1_i2.p1 TRINITY_DN2124_c0_g1~~TRINITY_DN2124_c0_g1_i2.p1  ORF type:complete len:453 (+),score=54.92 TRINITY_DN2124_c0_g1_i2:65-1423(+)
MSSSDLDVALDSSSEGDHDTNVALDKSQSSASEEEVLRLRERSWSDSLEGSDGEDGDGVTVTLFRDRTEDDTIAQPFVTVGCWKPHYYLYLDNILSSWGDRMWGFAVYYALSVAFPYSFLVSNGFALVTQAAIMLASVWIGRWLDRTPRLNAMVTAVIVQNLAVAASLVCIIIVYSEADALEIGAHIIVPWTNPKFTIALVSLLILGSVSTIASTATQIAINKDWSVIVAGSRSYSSSPGQVALNTVNRRISLSSKILAPLFFGLLEYLIGLLPSLIAIACWNLVSCVAEVLVVRKVFYSYPKLSTSRVVSNTSDRIYNVSAGDEFVTATAPETPMQLFMRQPSMWAVAAYALLFFNVLSPGAQFTNYLVYYKFSAFSIGIFSGVSSLFGIGSTFVVPLLMKKIRSVAIGTHFHIRGSWALVGYNCLHLFSVYRHRYEHDWHLDGTGFCLCV